MKPGEKRVLCVWREGEMALFQLLMEPLSRGAVVPWPPRGTSDVPPMHKVYWFGDPEDTWDLCILFELDHKKVQKDVTLLQVREKSCCRERAGRT